MKNLKTSDIAKAVGVHPNTVRLYEEWGFLQSIPRNEKGYRIYTEKHLDQMRLARTALKCEFVAGEIREYAASIVKTAAKGSIDKAIEEALGYVSHIKNELARAEEALELAKIWLDGLQNEDVDQVYMSRKDTAKLLNVSIDILRNWERNGLIEIPRNSNNGYRMYGQKEITRLKVIRTLRSANYSMMAILRMMNHIDMEKKVNIKEYIDTPDKEEDVVYATDRWISVLKETKRDAEEIILQLKKMSYKT